MSWPRFIFFNAAGGITWAVVIGLAYYYLGAAVSHVRGPLDIIIGIGAALVVVASLVYLHKTEDKYAARAEEAFPMSSSPPERRPGRHRRAAKLSIARATLAGAASIERCPARGTAMKRAWSNAAV